MGRAIQVLVVEDNLAACDLLESFFARSQTQQVCGVAHNGLDGLMLTRALRPDVVLLDLIMPVMDGMGFLEALRAEPPTKRPKVMVHSGVGSDEYVQRAIGLGASYYLMKPCRMEELSARIDDLFPSIREGGDGRCGWLLLQMGASRGCQGFRFACRGAELLCELGEDVLLKEIYIQLARENATTWSCVEKNLRTTIRQIHQAADPIYRERLGFQAAAKPPDNGAFLRALVGELRGES